METRKCPICGMELPEGGMDGLCPRCVLKELLKNEPDADMPEPSTDSEDGENTIKVPPADAPKLPEILAEKPGDIIGR